MFTVAACSKIQLLHLVVSVSVYVVQRTLQQKSKDLAVAQDLEVQVLMY